MTVRIPKGKYLGPGRPASGMLIVKDYMGIAGPYQVPLKKTQTALADIAHVVVEDKAQVRKSRVGKLALFGPLALLAKSSQGSVALTVHTKAGGEVFYEVLGMSAVEVRGRLARVFSDAGIALSGEEPSTQALTSLADELGKLSDLHERGVLSDAEFADQKAKLLAS